jgi:hypothetical protein
MLQRLDALNIALGRLDAAASMRLDGLSIACPAIPQACPAKHAQLSMPSYPSEYSHARLKVGLAYTAACCLCCWAGGCCLLPAACCLLLVLLGRRFSRETS